jgi:hypothetical protein
MRYILGECQIETYLEMNSESSASGKNSEFIEHIEIMKQNELSMSFRVRLFS